MMTENPGRSARLRTDIWVQALIRRCGAENVPAMVVRRGEAVSGIVMIKVNRLDGTAVVFSPSWAGDGARVWIRGTGREPVEDVRAEAYLAKQREFDPDIWIVEIEDRQGRHFIGEKVEERA